MSKTILITGGTGFVGKNTARALADKGYNVVATTRRSGSGQDLTTYSNAINIETVDLTRAAEVNQLFARYAFDGMVICAASHQDSTSRATNNAVYDMMLNCLDAASLTKVKRVVMSGAMSVYAGQQPPLTEDTEFSPEISYEGARGLIKLPKFEVRIKRIVEQILLDYGTPLERPTGSGGSDQATGDKQSHTLEVAVLRFPFQFGPGYTRMGNHLAIAAHAAAGRGENVAELRGNRNLPLQPLWSTVGAHISPIYVKDSAQALICALEADTLLHRIYNVTGNYSTSVKSQVEALYRAAPGAQEILKIDPAELPDEQRDLGMNINRIKQDLGWTPSFTMEQAFKDYIDWLKDKQNVC